MKILDCTLRDGGYYCDWDFGKSVVDSYLQAMNELPVDYLELGYRNNPSKEYLGKFGYCPVSVLKDIRNRFTKKLAVMINEKNTVPEDLGSLIKPIIGLVDMIRIAIDPKNIDRAIILAKSVKQYGFEVGFNVMYMSTWLSNKKFLEKLNQIDGIADLFCMVDSFGGITPIEVKEIINIVRSKTCVPIGFHGHDNLQLGLINTLTAIECGVDYVDATILGMGRGAGNCFTESLLSFLRNPKYKLFPMLNFVEKHIVKLKAEGNQWGYDIPYLLTGILNAHPSSAIKFIKDNRTDYSRYYHELLDNTL